MTNETKAKAATGEEARQALLELQQEANDGRPDLIINKVPKKHLRQFKDLAKEEFGGDYGMTLRCLMEQFVTNAKEYDMITRIIALESQVGSLLQSVEQSRQLERQIESSSRSYIKTLDQTIISDH